MKSSIAVFSAAVLAALLWLMPSLSAAQVRRDGDWPVGEEEPVSFSVTGSSRAEAIRRLADEAKWSVVVQGALTGTVDVNVKEQPAMRVLALILGDGQYVAHREGKMVAISREPSSVAPAATPAATPAPPASFTPSTKANSASTPRGRTGGKDLVVTGHEQVIGADQVVANLTVLAGLVEVYGTVSEDLAVVGGLAKLHRGSRVHGDIAVVGGKVEIDDGVEIEGDVSTLGGNVDYVVAGDKLDNTDDDEEAKEDEEENDDAQQATGVTTGTQAPDVSTLATRPLALATSAVSSVSDALTSSALLFLFGALLLAVAPQRLELLSGEVEKRPFRALLLGLAGLLGGLVLAIALCITLIGIPVAIVALLASALGVYAGICAALTLVGSVLLRSRNVSPYAHLALGCALYWVLSSLPRIGSLVTVAAVLIGAGALLATGAAGLLQRRRRLGPGAPVAPA